jgi:2-keto-myo-inositol isomerase
MNLTFALNRTVAPHRELEAFLELAREVGATGVEIRNDIEGQEFANGLPARELKSRIEEAGLTIASINALQRFNAWTAGREREARHLIEYAGACGAPGLVLCPVVDAGDGRSEAQLAEDFRHSLRELRPILASNGVLGLVEPLGMLDSTLRFKAPAVEAIGDINGFADFALCHDTFQHFRCGDTAFYPEHTAIIHISGIVETSLPREALTEPHRGLIDENDRCGNVEQLRHLLTRGYRGFVSFEPFDPKVQCLKDPAAALGGSIAYIRRALDAKTH